jgi:hypothetical protein
MRGPNGDDTQADATGGMRGTVVDRWDVADREMEGATASKVANPMTIHRRNGR